MLLFATQAKAQSSFTQNFAVLQPGQAISLIGTTIKTHTMSWYPQGTVTTCTVALDSSADGVTWNAGAVIAGQTCTSIGNSATVTSAVNFVRLNVTVLSGGGSVTVTWSGSSTLGGSTTVSTGGAATGTTPSGNPVLVAGQDATPNVRVIRTDSNGGIATVISTGPQADAQAQQPVWILDSGGNSTGPTGAAMWVYNGASYDKAVKCPTAVAIVVAAAGTQQVVAPVAGQKVRVCGLYLTVSTAGTLSITEGTGATCGTGTTTIFGQTVNLPTGGYPIISAGTAVMQTNVSGDGLCIVSGTAAVQGWAQVEQH